MIKLNGVKNVIIKWHNFWIAQYLICCFIVILFHFEGRWLLMRNLATILPLNFKSLEQKFRYGDIQKYTDMCFHSSKSRNGVVQMFFLTPNEKIFAGKFVKWARLLVVLREHIISIVKLVEVHKMFFEQNCIVKWVIFFASICWLCDFLLGNLKLRKKLWKCLLEHVNEYQKVACLK